MLGQQSGDVRESFRKEMENACEHAPDIDENRNVKEAWGAACTDIQGVASRVLGHGKRRKPDWFLESQSILEHLIEKKQLIHERMLANESASTRREFRAAQKSVNREVDCGGCYRRRERAKGWLHALEIHQELQGVHSGRQLVTISAVYNQGVLTSSPDSVRDCWSHHCAQVFIIVSNVDITVLQSMPTEESRVSLDLPPDFDEVMCAMRRLNMGTAVGESKIAPEFLRYGGEGLHKCISNIVRAVWLSGSVPPE